MPSAVLARERNDQVAEPRRVLARASAMAPMRISLAGGGTDVPPLARGVGGRVVCASIDLHVRATVEPFDPGWIRLEGSWGTADAALPSDDAPSSQRVISMRRWDPHAPPFRPGAPPLRHATFTRRSDEPPSTDVAFRLLEAVRAASGVGDGVRIAVESDLTPGTGLGGSAAAAVALLAAFRRSLGLSLASRDLATEASHLEREVLGLRCGLQDQLCAAEGGVLDLRFSDDGFTIAPIHAPPSLLCELEAGLLLVDTRVRRVSGEILNVANDGRAQDLPADLVAAADDTARGFRLGSLPLVLAGMRRSASAKLRRGGPSALPWDWVRKLSRLGAIVVRACGAGGGGHVLLWADPACHDALVHAVEPCIVRRPSLGVPGVTLDDP
jgi:D-glycero-alpha-D-manno-heptose-7-phosphate kinase